MSQSSNIVNKQHQTKRNSLTSVDENINGISLSLQSFVDDIPFEFNPKYRTIIVSHIDIPEYDTNKVHYILSKSIDFTLENKVLLEALENLKRKKKQIQSDNSPQQSISSSNSQSSNILFNDKISPTDISIPVNNVLPSRLSSVHNIYWPSLNQQEYNISSHLVKQTNHSFNNSNHHLAAAFDETLTSDDPFHDAELKSLNDVAELNHLYSANTIKR